MSSQDLISKVEETDALDVCRKAIQGMPHVDATNVEVLFDDQIPEGRKSFHQWIQSADDAELHAGEFGEVY